MEQSSKKEIVKKLHIEKDTTLTEESFKQVLKSGNDIASDKIQESDKVLVVDTTVIEIQRPSKSPNKFYSCKHKMFAVKVETLTDLSVKIVKISNLYSGREHDFKIRMNELTIHLHVTSLGDLGYFGYEKIHKKTITPAKRKKNQKLSKEEKERNREISKQRIVIEHVFAYMKRFKIIGSLYRDNLKKLHKIINIVAGIHNLNIK